jgi:pimeloyl-ACP methyl ester carboxylesterase
MVDVTGKFQQSLDRACIKAATASVRSGWRRADQTERAADLLARPDFSSPAVSPAKLDFSSHSRFTFRASSEHSWDAPNAHGRFRRAGKDWQSKPAVILIHGWNGEMGYYCSYPWIERALASKGINAISFELPFHGRRRPRAAGQIHNLISDDLVTMLEGVRLCLADALALRLWLREQGCPAVGLWGYSLGGWLSGLLTAHPDPFAASILMAPVSQMDHALMTLPFGEPVRGSVAVSPVDLGRYNLPNLTPTTPHTLIIECLRDLFVPAATLDHLAQAWPHAELWRVPQSHISIAFAPLTLLRAVRWMSAQLKSEKSHGH